MSSRPELRLDWCSHAAAKYAVEHWHYSRCLPKSRQNYLGVWEDGRFIGAVIYGRSISPYLGDAFGCDQWECCELTRIALASHEAPVSRIQSIALRMLKRRTPGLRLIISFADPHEGHVGGIYQAGGWVYVGTSLNAPRQVFFRGKWRNDTRVFKLLRGVDRSQYQWRETEPKHKYRMPLDDEMRAQIEPLRKPYPKRPKQATTGDQPACGGAAPTRTLQDV